MAFSIKMLQEPVETVYGEVSHWCQIEIGNFSERFHVPLTVWDEERYIKQWEDAIARILEGEAKNCLITGLRDPWSSDFISLFALYRMGNDVFIQSQIMLCKGNEDKITKAAFIDLVAERETHTEDGEKISEWKVSIDELRETLETGSGGIRD